MQFEIGTIVDGKVVSVKKFGAFVELPDGTSGMVHISEVSNQYIEDIETHLQTGQEVKVKILSVNPEGKIALSIKKALPEGTAMPKREHKPKTWQPRATVPQSEMTFEEMMGKFKQHSEEKMSDIKRSTEARRGGGGGYSRKGR